MACGGVPNTAARRYIEENIKDGNVNFINATEIDSTKYISAATLNKMRSEFAKTGNLNTNFPEKAPRTLYYTKIRYTVTHANGTIDTLLQTVYTDKEQTIVYAIKDNRNI